MANPPRGLDFGADPRLGAGPEGGLGCPRELKGLLGTRGPPLGGRPLGGFWFLILIFSLSIWNEF
eukprot:TRINITY_DN14286_c0_g1_i1.p2 TRINITY_DN14286_c0_g1~~TRINITY_DN14286_c0_g1_i1.p2  ORF type:complete len:65 (+),score=9.96 TRINITY_DN14286_c0_g1_i1:407-601(+)